LKGNAIGKLKGLKRQKNSLWRIITQIVKRVKAQEILEGPNSF
jgi:hypothetical protein